MKLFLVSDIFGRTPGLEAIESDLSKIIGNTCIIDPYGGKCNDFENQALAYQYFTQTVGLKKYQSILANHIKTADSSIVMIGFSVGASAIWGLSDNPLLSRVKQAFGFYGSQIRYSPDIKPLFNIELIFPEKESHFDVDTLSKQLKDTPRVTCQKSKGLHGFMNTLSGGFDSIEYSKYVDYLAATLKNQIAKTK